MTARTSERKRTQVLELQAEGLTQAEIAERLGLSQETVSCIERTHGKSRRPRRRSFADDATGFPLCKRPGK